MTLHLHFSNRHEPLVDALSEALDAAWTDFGAPPPVVVPSPAVAKWLKLRLCEKRGALVGLPTPTLEAFLWQALDPDPGMKILRADALQQALVPLLDERRLEGAAYAAVREYLCPRDGIDVRRRYQLAQALARLFLEYEYNRPSVWKNNGWAVKGVDQSWPGRAYFAKPDLAESMVETWQRDLHGAVFGSDGPLARTGRLGLPRLHRIRREGGWTPSGDAVMVFGVEKVSHFHRNLLLELSEKREVHLFLLNPCAEFWEDVDTSRRRRRRSFALPRFADTDYQASTLSPTLYPDGAKDLPNDPLLLQRWGRSSRESLALWSQAVDYDFDFLVDPPLPEASPVSVLGVLQQSITQRHPGPATDALELEDGRILSGPVEPDASVVLLDCPERGREMEAVRDQIVQWLSEDPDRMVSDAVVLLPDPAVYRTAIHRVFGATLPGEPGHLPWVVMGGSAGESRWARAVTSFLELAKGACDRPTVFEFFRNPLVQQRLRIDTATVARWESWAELSGMVRGWDAEHRAQMGDSPESALDPHTFRAGLLRLLLWPLADRAFALGLKTPVGLEERVPTTRDFDAQPSDLERFGASLERLFHDVRGLSGRCQILTPSGLVEAMSSLFDAWIGFEDEAESRVRRSLLEGLELLAIQEQAGRQRISLDELEETVKSLLDGELPASARAFAGALTFAPLKSGHVLPHGLVVLAGFGAQAFPGDGMRTGLDLLASSPLVGDADALRDNRALFLQAVLSARSRLVVSWIGRDIQKDERLEPSSVVLELEEALKGVVARSLRRRVRLLAREAVLPHEATEAEAPLASWDPSDRIEAEPPAREPWKREVQEIGSSVRVTVSDLKAYLMDSFLYHARRTMGWEEDEVPETLDASQEAIATTALHDAIWRTELLPLIAERVWRDDFQASEVGDLVRRFVETKSWEADFPEAVLAAAELEGLLEWADSLASQLRAAREEFPRHRLVCGADLSLGLPGRSAILELEIEGRKIVVSQRIACALAPTVKTDSVVLLQCTKVKGFVKNPSTVDSSKAFGARLQAAVLDLAGIGHPVRIRFFAREPNVKPADEMGCTVDRLWLETVLGDLLRDECQFLPAKAVLDAKPKDLTLLALREKIEGSDYADALQELFDPSLPGEEENDDEALLALARRRLGPFLEANRGA